jgi:serine/threonine protein kinase
MFSSNKLNDQFIITQNKLGNGAFGSVYLAKIDDKDIAVKCETKKSENLTLLREFKICRKIYMIKKYLKCMIVKEYKDSNNDSDVSKLTETISTLENNPIIKVYKYISLNNLLSIPEEFDINYMNDTKCIPETFSYI